MFLMWIVPLALIFLVVYTISGNNLSNVLKPAEVNRTCSHCGSAAQSDWKICPHCGQEL